MWVSAIHQKRAFPVFWMLLYKKGACNFAEQKQVLRPVIRLLRKYKLIIIGDREFPSIELAQWLHRQHLSFVLRQKCTTKRQKRQKFQPLCNIPVQPGIHLFYEHISFTQKKGFNRFNLAMIVARLIEPRSKLATVRGLSVETCTSTLGEILGVARVR